MTFCPAATFKQMLLSTYSFFEISDLLFPVPFPQFLSETFTKVWELPSYCNIIYYYFMKWPFKTTRISLLFLSHFGFSLIPVSSHHFCVPLLPFLRPRSTLPFFLYFPHEPWFHLIFFPFCSLSRDSFCLLFLTFSVSSLICFTYPPTLLYSRILSKTPLVHS